MTRPLKKKIKKKRKKKSIFSLTRGALEVENAKIVSTKKLKKGIERRKAKPR